MKIDRKETGKGTATITVTVETEDIKGKFNASLKDYAAKAQVKGFRKGKTPANFIRKMHGHGILADTVNNLLQGALTDYIKSEELDLIGQPIPSKDDSENIDLDPFKIADVTFNFDIGLAPEVKIKGAKELGTYTQYKVDVADDMVQDEINNGLKRLGTQEATEEAIIDNDMITIAAVELDGKKVKEGGHETEFVILVSMIKDEKAKAKMIGAKKGDSVDFDIYSLENGSSDDYVAKYLLKIEDPAEAANVGKMFRGDITEVKRVVEAEKNEEFFQKFLNDDAIKTEAQAQAKIKENITGYYNKESENLIKGKVASDLIEANPMEFPKEFMMRWIEEATEDKTNLNLEAEYDAYAKQLQWTMIKAELLKEYKLEILPEDLQAAARDRVMQYFGGSGAGMDEAMIEGIIPRLLNDQQQMQQIYTGVEFDKLMSALVKDVSLAEQSVNTDEFKDVVEKYNEEMGAQKS